MVRGNSHSVRLIFQKLVNSSTIGRLKTVGLSILILAGLELPALSLTKDEAWKAAEAEMKAISNLPNHQQLERLQQDRHSDNHYTRVLVTIQLHQDADKYGLEAEVRRQLRSDLQSICQTDQDELLREMAVGELFQAPWPGADEFFRESLQHGLLREYSWTGPVKANQDTWVPVLLKLLDGPEPARSNAARILAQLGGRRMDWKSESLHHQVAVRLMPWIQDPNWVTGTRQRLNYLQDLSDVDLPEASASLILVLGEKDKSVVDAAAHALFRNPTSAAAAPLSRLYSEDNPDRESFLALSRCSIG